MEIELQAIRIVGTKEELVAALRGVLAVLEGTTQAERGGAWTPELARRFWSEVQAPIAREALRLIAEAGPDGILNTDLARAVGVDSELRLAGALASVGFVQRRMGLATKPYTVQRRRYKMPEAVAEAIREAAKGG